MNRETFSWMLKRVKAAVDALADSVQATIDTALAALIERVGLIEQALPSLDERIDSIEQWWYWLLDHNPYQMDEGVAQSDGTTKYTTTIYKDAEMKTVIATQVVTESADGMVFKEVTTVGEESVTRTHTETDGVFKGVSV